MDKEKHIILPPYFTQSKIDKLAQIVPLHIDRVLLFYSYLMYRNLNKDKKNGKKFKQTRNSPFHQIHTDLIKIIFGRSKYRTVFNILSANGFIEINESYFTGIHTDTVNISGYAKSYKIPDKLVSNKYEKCKRNHQLKDGHTINAKRKLTETIRREKINTIKLEDGIKGVLLDSISNIDINTMPVSKWAQFETGPSMDPFGKRLHSAITNMKKKYRTGLRFKGCSELLVEVDITSSQVFFFANLNTDIIDLVLPSVDAIKVNRIINELLHCPSFILFRQAVLYGEKDIYDQFAGELGMERKQAKKLFFKIIFGSKYAKRSDELRYFDSKFPGLLDIVHSFQDIKISDSPKDKRTGNLALILQRIESKMVLTESISAAAEQGITDILTIHDSWLVKESQAEEFKKIVSEVFLYEFGATPQFGNEDDNPEKCKNKKSPQLLRALD